MVSLDKMELMLEQVRKGEFIQEQKKEQKQEANEGPKPTYERSKKISQLFEKATDPSFGKYDTFKNLVNLFYFTLTKDEKAYLELVRQLSKNTLECGTQIFAELMQALYVEQDYADYLGDAFTYLSLGNNKLGQNFTPWTIAYFMAKMTFSKEKYEKAKAEGRKITVCDPCVGAGVFLLSWKKVIIQELGLEALDQYEFYGTDIDPLCVQMTRVQMLLTDYKRMRDLLIVTAYEMKQSSKPKESSQPAEGSRE